MGQLRLAAVGRIRHLIRMILLLKTKVLEWDVVVVSWCRDRQSPRIRFPVGELNWRIELSNSVFKSG